VPDDNVEIVRRFWRDSLELYRAGGQLGAALDRYLDPEVEWETRWPGLEPWFYGRDGVRDWVRQVTEPMEMDVELLAARALSPACVLAEYRASGRGRGSDIPAEMKIFDLLWLRGGLIYRRRTFYTEQEALEAAGMQQ
jgi:hypothetical protein